MDTEELVERFQFFDDLQDRYQYLIDLGKRLEPLPSELKNEVTRVRGCMSQVWLVGEHDGAVMNYRADSDAFIVRGLIAVLLILYSGKPPAEVLDVDMEQIFVDIQRKTIQALLNNYYSSSPYACAMPGGPPRRTRPQISTKP